jgi:plastocyanin
VKIHAEITAILAAGLIGILPIMSGNARGHNGEHHEERAGAGESAQQDASEKFNAGIKLFQFRPGRIEVTRGATVTWINEDEIQHTITADDHSFDAPLDGKGKKFSFTFKQPGTYRYHCERHEQMRGEIEVR